jgi:LmbE family N-acetylglucosaminyl deacetylase
MTPSTVKLKNPNIHRRSLYERFKYFCTKPKVQKTYMLFAVCLLLASTAYWALIAARVHSNNADQLVNPLMFESVKTFKGASFPSQHTYFLKWPVFFLIFLFGETDTAYRVASVALAVIAVAIFAALIHKIERRNIVFGTLMLAFALVLFLIPAQPYPGGLLPMNMGMVSNRNIEYAIFLLCLCWIAVSHRWRSKTMIYAAIGLYILVLSDRLFAVLSVGGAAISIFFFFIMRRRQALRIAFNWLLLSVLAIILSIATMRVLEALNITHFSGSAQPYAVTHSAVALGKGLLYAATNLTTNFGANPAFGSSFLRHFPVDAGKHLFSLAGPGLILNIVTMLIVFVAVFKGMRQLLKKNFPQDIAHILLTMMIAISATSLASFVATEHYFPVDGRYLTIVLFALFVVLTLELRKKHYKAHYYVYIGVLCVISMVLSAPTVQAIGRDEQAADHGFSARNSIIIEAIKNHNVDTLVGDYWRVIPIKQKSNGLIAVTPLATCTELRSILTSKVWQPQLEKVSFAYLLSSDKPQTDFPKCQLKTIQNYFGKANASLVISGSIKNPTEQLLFYDYGAHNSAPKIAAKDSVTRPKKIETLKNTDCSNPTTIMNIVAHEDDDLLFINPDTQKAIKSGNCVRSIYLTSGDSGGSQQYWLSREQGTIEAYSTMLGYSPKWIERTIQLAGGQYIYRAEPLDNPKVSLYFFRLPDGNTNGEGFISTNNQSLIKLYKGKIRAIDALYGGSRFQSQEIQDALTTLMKTYKPTEVRTQSIAVVPRIQDHSDHAATTRFVDLSYKQYSTDPAIVPESTKIRHYAGYPVQLLKENISPADLEIKSRVFYSYAKHDPAVCQTPETCTRSNVYYIYLRRMYQNEL